MFARISAFSLSVLALPLLITTFVATSNAVPRQARERRYQPQMQHRFRLLLLQVCSGCEPFSIFGVE
ncbi:hypothetical protein ARMGADRAFT_734165 [Armillaria gallica]|uniref:Secreted protein n=1 Tax=Armillaria gallica TaxID=47427 RepID=A0A2H3CHD1_ARMGA|nr:hypothetical protein ARMGADRAFT_734165 [Armillaria gallica]